MVRARSPRWGLPIACGLLAASAIVFPRAAALASSTEQFTLRFDLATSVPAVLEVFVDRGLGFRLEDRQVVVAPSSEAVRPYVFPLPAGAYRIIRIDPFPADGAFVLENLRIVDRDGRTIRALPLTGIETAASVVVRERQQTRLSGTATGDGDPQLIARLAMPLVLWMCAGDLTRQAALFVLIALSVALATLWFDGWSTNWNVRAAVRRLRRHPQATIAAAAVMGTLAAMYPILLGRSLVTPNNGWVPFHYTAPPYVDGSVDTLAEDTRGTDIPAAMLSTLPLAAVQRESLRHGEVPFWNRYSLNGVPLLGQGQSALFDPLQWLCLIDNLALGADLKFVAGRLVFALGAGFAALSATRSLPAAAAIAVVSPFVGHFNWKVNHPGYFTIVYAPWTLFGYFQLRRARTRSAAARAALTILASTALSVFASPPKEAFVVVIATHATGVLGLVLPPHAAAASALRSRLAAAAVASAGALLLTAPHWMVFFETLKAANTLYGEPAAELGTATHLAWFLLGPFGAGTIHPGLNPVVSGLMIVALVSAGRWTHRPQLAATALVAGLFFAVTFGAVPRSWLLATPLVRNIHHLGTSLLSAAIPLCLVLAAAGVQTIVHARDVQVTRATVMGGGFAIAATCLLLLGGDLAVRGLGFSLAACVWGGVFVYAALRVRSNRRDCLAVVALLAAAIPLLGAGGLHFRSGNQDLDVLLLQPRLRARLDTTPAAMQPVLRSSPPERVVGTGRVLPASVPQYQLIETITGVEALSPGGVWYLGSRFTPAYPMATGAGSASELLRLAPLFDMWNVGWIVRPAAGGGHRLEVIRRDTAWPRAFLSTRVERIEDARSLLRRLQSDSRPFAAVDVGDSRALGLTACLEPGAAARIVPVLDYRLTPNTTSLTITTDAPGVVVLNETFWPGVVATVNGEPGDVFPVNVTMRGVVLSRPGTFEITFAYRPLSWNGALMLASGGLLIGVALLWAAGIGHRLPGFSRKRGGDVERRGKGAQ